MRITPNCQGWGEGSRGEELPREGGERGTHVWETDPPGMWTAPSLGGQTLPQQKG